MQAEKFYQLDAAVAAVSVQLVTMLEWQPLRQQLDAFQQQQLSWQNFSANLGECVLLFDSQGNLEKVYVGVQGQKYFTALAMAANRLPQGRYRLQNKLAVSDLLAWGMAQYKYTRYKMVDVLLKVLLLDETLMQEVTARVDAVYRVRDLINTPSEDMGPKELSDVLSSLAQRYQGEFSTVIGEELLSKNFPGIYAVGRAAVQAPRLLQLAWGNAQDPLIVLVGKGVCFDSGGLNLKNSAGMRLMKKDMGGAAQVMGLAELIMHFQLPIRLLVLCPCVENTIDAGAYRPGDVVRMRNGMHVEIDNTDAEGRVILADALVYACEQSPQLLLDIATLTGAARVAVGTEISALFTNSKTLATTLVDLGEIHRDPIWSLPLYEGYQTMNDSAIADISNSTASSYAGAITAALFLQRFLDPNVIWGHFDLMAYNVTNRPGHPEGGEAMSILALFEYLRQTYSH